jgi:hypothetical protein
MKDFQKNIDKLVSKILNEEIETRVKHISETKGEWVEINVDEELSGKQSKIDVAEPKGKITAADFKKLRDAKNHKKEVEEYYTSNENNEAETDEEMEEGNEFTGALAKAKESGKDSFEVDGKKYSVKESENKLVKKLKTKNTLSLTEDELIDMIESIVNEQIINDPSEEKNLKVNKPQGLKKTEKAQTDSKKENDKYAKDVVKKMKDYMKDMYMGGGSYDENPEDFPQSNYQMDKDAKVMKYHPSDAVDEYIEAFAYPGMTNLVYDEIKPDDEMISKQIKGDSRNGNAVTGKDGKALGNVSKRSTKVGDRFKKNFDDNLYGAEQMEVSYNRQPQPVDVAGSKKQAGSLKSIKSTSKGKAEKIMSQLESVESKATKIINEDLEKMKNLISYNRKTQ